MSPEEAFSYLDEHIPDIELTGEKHEQMLEMMEGDQCTLKFTRVETDKDGKSDTYDYEFMVPDISKDNSNLSIDGKIIEINLKTADSKKLFKPYKNGEVENFEYEFTIYADDVWLAKQILSTFGVLSEKCK